MIRFHIGFISTIAIFLILNHLPMALCRPGATEEQMWAAGRMMRDVCFPKFPKVTMEIADDIHNGIVPTDNKDAKCYINCIMEMMQTIKKGKFQLEASLKQVDLMLPDQYKDDYRSGLTACKDASAGIKNNCDSAAAILTCLQKRIKIFLFP